MYIELSIFQIRSSSKSTGISSLGVIFWPQKISFELSVVLGKISLIVTKK